MELKATPGGWRDGKIDDMMEEQTDTRKDREMGRQMICWNNRRTEEGIKRWKDNCKASFKCMELKAMPGGWRDGKDR